jgi:uncharacterized membrane protein
MSDTVRGVVLGIFVLTTAIWIGGYIVNIVVARVAVRTLPPAERIAFFRGLGRSYGIVGGLALLVALGTGGALLGGRTWSATLTLTTLAAASLVVVTVVGVVQARRMTRLRCAHLDRPDDPLLAGQVRAGARHASLLRAAIGVLSLTVLALGCLLAT